MCYNWYDNWLDLATAKSKYRPRYFVVLFHNILYKICQCKKWSNF